MKQQLESKLFLLSLWSVGDGKYNSPGVGWEGRIQLIGEGWADIFTDWPTLQDLLQEVLLSRQGSGAPTHEAENGGPHDSGSIWRHKR